MCLKLTQHWKSNILQFKKLTPRKILNIEFWSHFLLPHLPHIWHHRCLSLNRWIVSLKRNSPAQGELESSRLEPFNSWELTAKQGRQTGPADPPFMDQAQVKQLRAKKKKKKFLPALLLGTHMKVKTSNKVLSKIITMATIAYQAPTNCRFPC